MEKSWIKTIRRLFVAPHLIDVAASLLFGGGALWLASMGETLPAVFTVGVWLWLAGLFAATLAADMVEMRQSAANRRLWARIPRRRVNRIAGIVALAVASGVLFAFGEFAVAVATELMFFVRLREARGDFDRPRRNRGLSEPEERWWSIGYEYLFMPVGALWIALGVPPAWAEAMIVASLWILPIGSLCGASIAAGERIFRGMRPSHPDARFRAKFPGKEIPREPQDYPPEPERHWLVRISKWPYRMGVIAATWALWTAGRPELAAVFALGALAMIAWHVASRRKEYGPLIRVDAVARAVHAIMWPPLKFVGSAFLVVFIGSAGIIVLPILLVLGSLYERVIPFGREQKARQKRQEEAADGRRLCQAFERPDGFIYFLYSSPQQYEYFMAEDGVMRLSGLPIVARNWQQDVKPIRIELGAKEFEETPEGSLLSYMGFRTWFGEIPLVAVVPPVGGLSAYNFADPYRCRIRDPRQMEAAESGLANTISELTRKGRF